MIARALPLLLIAGAAGAAEFPARLDWSQRVDIAASVAGVVETVDVRPGQTIAKGAPLLSLNQTVYKAAMMEARADIERLTQEAADAKRELERAEELYARTVSSTTEFDAAKLRHARTGALLAAAEARVEKARHLLDESAPRAPFDALVLNRAAEPGMTVTAQCQPTVLLTLARADQIIASTEITAEQATGLAPDAPAQVNIGGRDIAGKIVALRAQANGRYRLDVVFPREAGLLAGLPATLRLP